MPKKRIMPKKRRTPAQRAASRRNLEKARAARKKKLRGTPHGKTLLLYHFTNKQAADKIVKEGFKPIVRKGTFTENTAYQNEAWFFTHKAAKRNLRDARRDMKRYGRTQYGLDAVSVKVPFKATTKESRRRGGGEVYTVPFEKLKGRKIKRVLRS